MYTLRDDTRRFALDQHQEDYYIEQVRKPYPCDCPDIHR